MDEILEGISNAKKLLDAQNDIKDINKTIRDNYAIQHRANNMYHSLTSEPDYIPYINTFKAKYRMGGDLPFEFWKFVAHPKDVKDSSSVSGKIGEKSVVQTRKFVKWLKILVLARI